MATTEKFAREFDVTVAQLLTWESDPAFVQAVRSHDAVWVFKRRDVMQALLARAKATTDKEQLRYAAAFLIAIGDEKGHELSKLVE